MIRNSKKRNSVTSYKSSTVSFLIEADEYFLSQASHKSSGHTEDLTSTRRLYVRLGYGEDFLHSPNISPFIQEKLFFLVLYKSTYYKHLSFSLYSASEKNTHKGVNNNCGK